MFNFLNTFTSAIGGAVRAIAGTALGLAGTAVSTVQTVASNLANTASTAAVALGNTIATAAGAVSNVVNTYNSHPDNLPATLSAFVSGVSSTAQAAGSGVLKTAVSSLQSVAQSAPSVSSFLQTSLDSMVSLAVTLVAIPMGYYQWQMVELPISSGASCGNGSPYRFFVNKSLSTTNTVIYIEGGGWCYDYKTCAGQDPHVGATNSEGEIPRDYMTLQGFVTDALMDKFRLSAAGMETPMIARQHPLGRVQTQSWNIVFTPFCTADMHAGNTVNLYENPNDPTSPKVYFHKGHKNAQLVAAWVRDNLPKPEKLLVTGSSAGGFGTTFNYGTYRDTIAPRKSSAMLNDSGIPFWSPQWSIWNVNTASSLPALNKAVATWKLNNSGQILDEYRKKYPKIDTSNLGSIASGWAQHFPSDRIGLMTFQADEVIPSFLYSQLGSYMAAEGNRAAQLAIGEDLYRKEIQSTFFSNFPSQANIGYYLPNWRGFIGSHTLLSGSFGGTGIQELGVSGVTTFVDNLLDNSGVPVMRAAEKNTNKIPYVNSSVDRLMALF